MAEKSKVIQLVWELWLYLPARRRRQFFIMLFIMVASSFAEVVSVGAVLPFLGLLIEPERVFLHPLVQPFIRLMNIESAQQLVLPVVLLFCFVVTVAGAIRVLLLYCTNRYSSSVGSDISIDIYRRVLYQPYATHVSRNSSEIINGISGKASMMIGSVLFPLLTLCGAAILLVFMVVAFVSIDPFLTASVIVGFLMIYLGILFLVRKNLQRNSRCVAVESTAVIKCLQEGLGGIRDVLIDGTQETYCRIYQKSDRPLRLASAWNSFISASPRYIVEALGMILIVFLTYWILQRNGGGAAVIPIVGAFALGAQRLLPVLQQGYSAVSSICGVEASLRDVVSLLKEPIPSYADGAKESAILFQREIRLKDLGFRYSDSSAWVFRGVNLRLEKGKKIGFIGVTGSGKSTLLDIVMGLFQPTEGVLEIDGREFSFSDMRHWRAHIAHVPQTIYLADTSIEENIAFGMPKEGIDHARVVESAEKAQIAEFIESLPKKYQTLVGERGVCLSGGQRQRVGIARALYKKADVIIFDEATSALDNETERAVMEAVEALGEELTILIIAHRLSTLKNCDQIIEIADGGVKRIGKYHELVTSE